MNNKYGFTVNNDKIIPRKGWRIIPEGSPIPQYHMEYHEIYSSSDSYTGIWAEKRRCHSTMTPLYACVYGSVKAFAESETIKRAVLVKRITDNGLFELKDHLKIGITYEVDISTKRVSSGFNIVKEVPWTMEIIFMTDGQWVPTELLNIEE